MGRYYYLQTDAEKLFSWIDSNVAAGKLFGIPLRGTHSHAFVSSFMVRSFMSCSRIFVVFFLYEATQDNKVPFPSHLVLFS